MDTELHHYTVESSEPKEPWKTLVTLQRVHCFGFLDEFSCGAQKIVFYIALLCDSGIIPTTMYSQFMIKCIGLANGAKYISF
jgi:hypothetical protein